MIQKIILWFVQKTLIKCLQSHIGQPHSRPFTGASSRPLVLTPWSKLFFPVCPEKVFVVESFIRHGKEARKVRRCTKIDGYNRSSKRRRAVIIVYFFILFFFSRVKAIFPSKTKDCRVLYRFRKLDPLSCFEKILRISVKECSVLLI